MQPNEDVINEIEWAVELHVLSADKALRFLETYSDIIWLKETDNG